MKVFVVLAVALVLALALAGCTDPAPKESKQPAPAENQPAADSSAGSLEKVVKSEAEWKAQLSEKQYYVVREKGTERAFTGELLKEKRKGVYRCVACDLDLFPSEAKFKSGTGWPSFHSPTVAEHVGRIEDRSHGMVRVEVVCSRCDGHLGHVFRDGPAPTGLRYCINSASLRFEPQE